MDVDGERVARPGRPRIRFRFEARSSAPEVSFPLISRSINSFISSVRPLPVPPRERLFPRATFERPSPLPGESIPAEELEEDAPETTRAKGPLTEAAGESSAKGASLAAGEAEATGEEAPVVMIVTGSGWVVEGEAAAFSRREVEIRCGGERGVVGSKVVELESLASSFRGEEGFCGERGGLGGDAGGSSRRVGVEPRGAGAARAMSVVEGLRERVRSVDASEFERSMIGGGIRSAKVRSSLSSSEKRVICLAAAVWKAAVRHRLTRCDGVSESEVFQLWDLALVCHPSEPLWADDRGSPLEREPVLLASDLVRRANEMRHLPRERLLVRATCQSKGQTCQRTALTEGPAGLVDSPKQSMRLERHVCIRKGTFVAEMTMPSAPGIGIGTLTGVWWRKSSSEHILSSR